MISFHIWTWELNTIQLQASDIIGHTGKSLSEALIFASTNPQYDNRSFIEFTSSIYDNAKLKPGENMLCTEIVSDIQNSFCTQHVLPMF